ncbi:hypothetical protein LCGC14_2373200 [marine sediment metagenome]|uniref:Transposase InsH N-terminal domain-containing protein n=1 Tax=marine sediment metagenome TaxID=412755 RepID=A0A0F9EXR0_9ZZZZ
MQGKDGFLPETRTVINLESFIPDDHFLRKVDRVLDLSFVRELTAPCYVAGRGRPCRRILARGPIASWQRYLDGHR